MTLPEIVLPKVELPFDIPVLLHPAIDHFLIAIPVVVLLLELMNLIMKKKAVGGVSFFLLILTVLFSAAAYLSGLADGKEAFPALSEVAKTALSEHKLLGTYLMLGSVVVLLLKLLAMTGNKILRGIYIFVLIAFVAVMFKQGDEGGDLVYVHGINVQQVSVLEETIEDLNETLEGLKVDLSVEQNQSCSIPTEESNTSLIPSKDIPVFKPLEDASLGLEEKASTTVETVVNVTEPVVEVSSEVQEVVPSPEVLTPIEHPASTSVVKENNQSLHEISL